MSENAPAAQLREQIVGYDARDYRDDFGSQWPLRRREQFLYRLDVRKVLSVDTRVWPCVFASMGRPTPFYQPAMQKLWADAGELRGALSEAALHETLPPFRTVAITLVADGAEKHHPTAEQAAALAKPVLLAPKWRLLGFDVADAWALSALSNCGFLPDHDDVVRMRQLWAPHLNEFHLFTELDAASAFRRMSDQRLEFDHAPTFVYGIRLVS